MNILLTSAGRRSYLVDYFKEAWKNEGLVHVANSSKDATSVFHADKYFITPEIYDESYISILIGYCKENNINAILSLFDIDLPVLAKNKERFAKENIRVIVSDPEVMEICNDKWRAFTKLVENGIKTPLTFKDISATKTALKNGELRFPVVMKPRWGMGSIGIYIVENMEELEVFYKRLLREISASYLKFESAQTPEEMVLFQEFIKGKEYGLDVVHDLEGNFKTTFVKRKLAMRSGETDAAVTVQNDTLFAIGEKIGKLLKHIGNLDADVLEADGTYYVLEMNARFGGGYPFSHLAGANLPLAILHWLKNEPAEAGFEHFKYNVTGFKHIIPEVSPLH